MELEIRAFAAAGAALAGSFMLAVLASRLGDALGGGPGKALRAFRGEEEGGGVLERIGARLSRPLAPRMSAHLRWLEAAGEPASLARAAGLAAVLGAAGLAGLLALQAPPMLLLALIGAAYPFARIRAKAIRVRRRALRALPDLAALMAAEMAAGNPPDLALERAGYWGGPLGAVVREAVAAARERGCPLFSRSGEAGMFRAVAERYDLPALQAFAAQIDLAAKKGAAGPEMMEALARTLIIEYKDRALREAEGLDNRLVVPAVLLIFFPMFLVMLAPTLIPLINRL